MLRVTESQLRKALDHALAEQIGNYGRYKRLMRHVTPDDLESFILDVVDTAMRQLRAAGTGTTGRPATRDDVHKALRAAFPSQPDDYLRAKAVTVANNLPPEGVRPDDPSQEAGLTEDDFRHMVEDHETTMCIVLDLYEDLRDRVEELEQRERMQVHGSERHPNPRGDAVQEDSP